MLSNKTAAVADDAQQLVSWLDFNGALKTL